MAKDNSRDTNGGHPSEGPLRIGFYAPALPDSGATNGIVTYTRIMRDALRALGHSVVVVTTEAMERADGKVVELPRPNALWRRARAKLDRSTDDGSHRWVRLSVVDAFLAAKRAGVQVFEMEESFGWAGQLAGRGVAIVERLHGPHIFVRDAVESVAAKAAGDLRQAAEFDSFPRVQAITAPTQDLLDALVQHGLNSTIAATIPNPIHPAPLEDSWSIDEADSDQLLFVGRFDLCKGADLAIRAFAEAAADKPELKLIMVGPDTGISENGTDRVSFEQFVARGVPLELRSRIAFLGPQTAAAIGTLRRHSGVALVCSRFETFGYNIAEALASGMPVLTSSTFGGASLVREGIEGRLVPIGQVNAAAKAIVDMTGNRDSLAEMGRRARERVVKYLSPELIASRTVEIYRDAIARARSI